MRVALLLAVLGSAAGCGSSPFQPVRAWEREVLARPDMAWDPDPLEAAHRAHVFFSKEGALVGGSAGGGGCGCN